ncbi:uncharacterized protein K460DRAFT_396201 [Cucurbitaria berberidis CBS 394.84]|uniref:DUF7892 domain-containing protein n=1 Tax=Cucurbitaria berberidis CBS 394.84 TaxID=1168544 RepID=A0A9P4GBT8_9PLEO|nr:uncharacterized protein K460DRAFT_396201 [Cucurbitaria berberidis CBS 394.84]KAF1842700.1 hypothetical protein K460DRAFT_396201 [Cucurbitaria berberidis CBS 394.84]
MEERESSVASSADFYGTEAKSNTPTSDVQNPAPFMKRKAEDLSSEQGKKPRLDCLSSASTSGDFRPCARLPPAVWQHVFLYCSLADLGRLIQVNRLFLSYLTDVRNVSTSKPEHGCLRLLKSESLWASARNALPTKPPKPLPGFTELQMWQLAWRKRCQFCDKLSSFTPGERIWQKGPGETGVRAIWPFAVRACGPCLLEQCQTDSSLLFSAASALRPALPFALVTNDHNYITAYTLQSATTPADIEIGKYYYKKHVAEITQELNDALRLGPAAAEEWSKGLDIRGKERMRIAENWERWEVKHQWWEEHQEQRATSAAPSLAATSQKEPSKSPTRQMPSPVIYAPIPASKYASHVSRTVSTGSAFSCFTNTPAVPNLTAAAPSQYVQPRPTTVPPQVFTPHPVPTGSTAPTQRNLHDAIEAKANRKTDIEQRCQQMDPPIPPNILRHMDSFKAAIQISQPMNDHAWSVLQPRLLAQLPDAQQAEADHVSRVAVLPTRTTDRRHHDGNSKETKEAMDRDWEESQRPIRTRLSTIAEEFINQDWDRGNAVTYENSPKFAADLLSYVRRTFYADPANDGAARLGQPGQDSNTNANTKPKLVLDDMKWVYDNKLKPLTEQFRKEIFLCYGNDCDRNTRFYGFEGVIQHFGARHTNAFSVGNVVVAWREAEWPEETPFHPDPISVKHAYHAPSNSTGYGNYYGGYSRAGTSTPHMQPHLPQASPGPYQYGGYNGPFAPPQTPSSVLPGFGYPQPYATPADNYAYQATGAPGYGHQTGHTSYIPSPAMINPAVAPPPAMPPPGQGPADTNSHGTEDAGHSTSSFDKQVSTVIGMAQDIWKQTSGIKDMPNSLRIYVLLHRVISKFHIEFNHEPNLNHFIDALSNHEIPKGLKNAPGLSCKACQVASSHQITTAYYSKPEERKTYTVLNLLSHFQAQHLSLQQTGPSHGLQNAPLDWKEDMIELPNERFIRGFIHAPGMDDEKLLMIATVFPRLFPVPLPKIGVIDSHGVASPVSSGLKDAKGVSGTTDTAGDALEKRGSSSLVTTPKESSLPSKTTQNEYDPLRPTLTAQANEPSTSMTKKQSYQGSPPAERRQRYHAEPRYYVGGLQDPNERINGANLPVRQMSREHLDEGYSRPREYVEYAPSPRIAHPSHAYEEYSGRRTVFREQDRFRGPPEDEVIYTHPREGSHGSREYSTYPPRQVRYYEEDEQQPEYRYVREPPPREASPPQGQSAADRFLEEFVPGRTSASESTQSQLPLPPETKPSAPVQESEDSSRYTPPPLNVSKASELGAQIQPLAPPHPRAPSTVSNGSRYEEHRVNGHYIHAPSSAGAPRRAGPHRRRDRPHEHRMPSRFYRYMSVARDDPYGRASSMSRSQSRRYEEQRRRIDQQETPQPTAEHDYEPAYSRDPSIEQPSPEDSVYPRVRQQPRDYVSVQDRLHPYSPPRYRYDEPRGPQAVYVDEYGQPVHEYEIIRVRGDSRQPRGYQPARYEPEHYQYVPFSYERPPSQRHSSRPEEYMYYEERERPLSRRPAPEAESEIYEPLPPEIKLESTPVPVPEGP